MGKFDSGLDGLGLHGQAIVAALDLYDNIRSKRPELSEVAYRLNVDLGQLRDIFPDDEALLIAVGEQALIRLIDASTKAVVKVAQDDAVGQFIALGDAYISWVARHPVEYRLISDERYLGPAASARLRRYIDSINSLMERILLRAQANGHLSADEDVHLIVLSSRIFATGLAEMLLDSRLSDWDRETSSVANAHRAMQHFVRSFARGTSQRASVSTPDRRSSTLSAGH